MGKIMMSPRLIEALRELGVEPDTTRRVIIDIHVGRAPAVYIQQVGTDDLPDVLFGLADMHPDVWERRSDDSSTAGRPEDPDETRRWEAEKTRTTPSISAEQLDTDQHDLNAHIRLNWVKSLGE